MTIPFFGQNWKKKKIVFKTLLLRDHTKSTNTISDIVYLTLQKEYFTGHSANIALCICWNTFIDYLSGVLYCEVYRTITLFAQFWNTFFPIFRRERLMVTLFESPKEIRKIKKVLSLAFMLLPFFYYYYF